MAKYMRILRLIRITRVVRSVRVFSCFDPLHLMVTAIGRSLSAFCFSAMLLLMVLTVFAMTLSQYFRIVYLEGQSLLTEDVKVKLFTYFGTYSRSMLSMFELTLANWPEICRFLVEEVHEGFSAFCLIFKLSIGFAVIGVINGVFIQQTFSAAQSDELIMVRKQIREVQQLEHRLARLFKMADINNDSLLTRSELGFLLQKRSIRLWLEAMEIPCTDIGILFDVVGKGKAKITAEEFISGITRLKGGARNIDMLSLLAKLVAVDRQHCREKEEEAAAPCQARATLGLTAVYRLAWLGQEGVCPARALQSPSQCGCFAVLGVKPIRDDFYATVPLQVESALLSSSAWSLMQGCRRAKVGRMACR
ncbi:unnamed protein product [Prorocentrum cordatum]|uniref:EF-hand domain-containing protein n=1 Tax=Prorocentrum cordatum TaxID=2364126 RepID=A0ABN9VPQ9_9DINO|nr:unnamed protein product [Polarella glacialis]